jgi:hypothetical protein
MPHQKGNEESQGYHHEERQTGVAGHLPGVRDQDIPNWEGLGLYHSCSNHSKRLGLTVRTQPFRLSDMKRHRKAFLGQVDL